MPTVQLAGNGFGGVVQGNFGTYQAAADGSFTVDARDVPSLLTRGMAYVKQTSRAFALPLAPAAASVGGLLASGALSNASVSVTAQPDTMRPVNFEWGTGTTAITAGQAAITYTGNDGVVGTDIIPLATALSTANTVALSRGVTSIAAGGIVISGLVGGTSPWRRVSTTAGLSVPVDPSAVDFSVTREYDAGATIAVGALISTVLGSITPTTAPNATVTYSFNYAYLSPVS